MGVILGGQYRVDDRAFNWLLGYETEDLADDTHRVNLDNKSFVLSVSSRYQPKQAWVGLSLNFGRTNSEADFSFGILKDHQGIKSDIALTGLEAGYTFDVAQGHILEPALGLYWLHQSIENYRTQFSDDMGAMDYETKDLNGAQISASLLWQGRAWGKTETQSGWTPSVKIGLVHQLNGNTPKVKMYFDSAYEHRLKLEDTYLTLQTKAQYQVTQDFSMSFSLEGAYSGEAKSTSLNWQGQWQF